MSAATVRAVVCTSLTGEDGLEVVDDWPAPGPCGASQVRIAVEAVSVNFPDTLITRGLYQLRREPPFVLGCEAAGVVTEVGDDVADLAVGDRVLSLPGVSAFASEITVTDPVQHVYRIPDAMGFDQAAAFDLTFGTAGHGLLQRGNVRAGESVLVNGAAGGCGSAAVQIAKAAGAEVVAVVGGAEKAAVVAALGADHVIDHHTLEGERALSTRVKERTGDRGVDVVFDNVGEDVRDLLRCLTWNGRFLVVGFAGGEVPTMPLNLTVLRSVSVVGVAYGASAIADSAGNRTLFDQLFAWFHEGRLAPHIGGRFALADAAEAVRAVRDRRALGKVVIEMGDPS